MENDVGDSCHEDVATNFNSWAHRVVVNKKSMRCQPTSQKDRQLCERIANIDFENALVETSRESKPKLPAHGIVVRTEQELDHALHTHTHIHVL